MSLILNVAVMGVGMHLGAWREPSVAPFSYLDQDYYLDIARKAEAACFHAVFLADTLIASEERFERPNFGAMDPTLVLASMAAVARKIGLIATASTTFNDPFNLARRFETLDHLSRGRAGWNIVTTFLPDVAANFGASALPASADRYDRAEEFVDVVLRLWESWPADALIGDQQRGIFADADRIRPIDHTGKHFHVRGPLTLPGSAQARPLLFQSGSSGPGRELAARTADAVFTAQNTLTSAQTFYAEMKSRARDAGRNADSIKIVPGLFPVLGATPAEAQARKARLDEAVGDAQIRKLARRLGLKMEDLKLDEPLPFEKIKAAKGFVGSEGFRDSAMRLAAEKNLTVREVANRNGGGMLQVVGTPNEVADTIETWHREKGADGFVIMPDSFPEGFDDFVTQVVPLLQERGVFRRIYEGDTLRANFGLPPLRQEVESPKLYSRIAS